MKTLQCVSSAKQLAKIVHNLLPWYLEISGQIEGIHVSPANLQCMVHIPE